MLDSHVKDINRNQPGDPEKAAAVIIELFNDQNPPLHIFLGSDAYARAQEKMKIFAEEVEKWKGISLSADL